MEQCFRLVKNNIVVLNNSDIFVRDFYEDYDNNRRLVIKEDRSDALIIGNNQILLISEPGLAKISPYSNMNEISSMVNRHNLWNKTESYVFIYPKKTETIKLKYLMIHLIKEDFFSYPFFAPTLLRTLISAIISNRLYLQDDITALSYLLNLSDEALSHYHLYEQLPNGQII